jgi:hypothetical protein
MPVTLLGMVTLVRPVQELKALSPMVVTGSPCIVGGILTAVFEPA